MKQEEKDMPPKDKNCCHCFCVAIMCIIIVFAMISMVAITSFRANAIIFLAIALTVASLGCCAMICMTIIEIKWLNYLSKRRHRDLDHQLLEKVLSVRDLPTEPCKKEINVNIGFGKSKR